MDVCMQLTTTSIFSAVPFSLNFGAPWILQNLLKLYERQETIIADLRAKLRLLRKDVETKDKQVELAHRTIERLSVDKNGLEAGDAAKKTYIRQLESRVAGMKGTTELREVCGEMQAEIQKLRAQLKLAEEKTTAAEAAAEAQQAEMQLLQRGLQLAAEQLAKSVGSDVPANLFINAAEGQSQAVELSAQLAESQAQLDEMATALTAARAHLQTQHEALQQWQQWEAKQTQENAERDGAFMVERKSKEMLQRQVEALRSSAQEAQRERDAARHRLELEKTAREESESKRIALQEALRKCERSEAALRAEVQRLVAADLAHKQAAEHARAEVQAQLEEAKSIAHAQARAQAQVELDQAQAAARAQAQVQAHAFEAHLSQAQFQSQAQYAQPQMQMRMPSSHTSPSLSPAVSPSKQLRGMLSISGSPRPDRAGVDESLAALEEELIEMAAHAELMPHLPPVPPSSPEMPSRLASPQRRIDAAGGKWRNNPLASPDRPYFRAVSEIRSPGSNTGPRNAGGGVAPSAPSLPPMRSTASVPQSQNSMGPTSSEEAWRTLEQGLEGQRQEERRMEALRQERAERMSVVAASSGGAEMNRLHGVQGASRPATSPVAPNSARRPVGMRIEIPGSVPGSSAPASPGIASSRAAPSSPDLDRFCTNNKSSTDWLSSPAGKGGNTEMVGSGKKGTPVREVRLHAYAGFSPSPMAQARGPPKSPGVRSPGVRRPVRQSLFDLAKQELTY